ncbi:hypothetical protein ACFCYH_26535 [Streptomyces sp. NPDC056400]|uniref:hypothetical protein n=1 Tax=Streptomyces sp. NPDC056400 TaxID=3345808 RepID=UPI0035E192B0
MTGRLPSGWRRSRSARCWASGWPRLVRLQSPDRPVGADDGHSDGYGDDGEAVATLRQARDSAAAAGLDAGVLEDWQPLLELVAAGSCRAAPPGNALDPLGPPKGSRGPRGSSRSSRSSRPDGTL